MATSKARVRRKVSALRSLGVRARRGARARLTRINQEPIFVLGQVKSGTTAISALLAQRTGSTVTLDIPALFGQAYVPVQKGEVSLASIVRSNRVEFSRDIIKQASLTWLYQQTRALFPKARFVMIVRDPRDNIRSTLNRLGLPGDQADLSTDQLASLPGPWRWNFERPDELGVNASSYIEILAEGWRAAADVYLDNPAEMHLVRYEDFLLDKAGCISACATDLGLPIVNDISRLVDVQYQPRGDREITWEAFFGTHNLSEIEARCEEQMLRLGYEITDRYRVM
jgi:hypothetical protein